MACFLDCETVLYENLLNDFLFPVTLNFTNYRTVHPALVGDEESEEDEDDYLWEERPAKGKHHE